MDTLVPEHPPTQRSTSSSSTPVSVNKPRKRLATSSHTSHTPSTASTGSSEEDKLKSRHLRQYTRLELISKSIRFSLQNWKMNVYNQLNSFLSQFFSMYGPVYNARLIDAITKQKDADALYRAFKAYILFLLVKLVTTEGM